LRCPVANADAPTPEFSEDGAGSGGDDCLRKPFTLVALILVINECLADNDARGGIAQQSS
jgi:hypothetical protein